MEEPSQPQEQEAAERSLSPDDCAPPGLLVKPPPPGAGGSFSQQVEDALVGLLQNKPGNSEHMSKVGIFLRQRRLLPDGKLKTFLDTHCPRLEVYGPPAGSQYVCLAGAGGPPLASSSGNSGEPTRPSSAGVAPAKTPRPASAGANTSGDDIDEEWLEQALVAHMRTLPGQACAGPTLGDYCLKQLNLSMRGKLVRFLQARPHVFHLALNDPRQVVTLVGGGPGPRPGGPAPVPQAKPAAPPPQRPLPPDLNLPDTLPGSAHPGGLEGSDVAASVLPGAAAAAREMRSPQRWDGLTQEVYNFVRARGVATFSQIDQHMRTNFARLISAQRIPPHAWSSDLFLRKRRGIFRIQGPVVSLAAHVPGAEPAGPSGAPPSGPLPHARAPAGAAGAAPAGPATAAAAAQPGHNPVLDAFIAERRNLEELRDDIQHKLASFKALSELQKENAGLRAACVTLGRELLGLKTEFTLFKQQMEQALLAGGGAPLGALEAFAADVGTLPSPLQTSPLQASTLQPMASADGVQLPQANGAPVAAAAGAPAAQYVPVPGTAGGALPSTTQAEAAPAEAAAAAAAAAAGLRQPAAAAAPAPAPSHDGGILLVGGHDGVSWLDSADFFLPRQGVWTCLPILDQPRSFAAVAATPSDIFITGGGNGMDWYSTVVRYDRHQGLGSGAWQALASMNVARGSLAAAVACGRLYVFGGGKPKEQYNVSEWYDAAQDRWFIGPALSSRRFALGGAAMDNALYAVGGYDGESYLTTLERLDPREGRWAVLPGEMASKRGGHACVAAGGLLYALGGFDSQQAIPHCEVFDPRANGWRPLADMADSRAYGSAAAVGGEVYAVGGLQSDMQTHAILLERYDPAADAWVHVELPPNANPRRSFLAACGLE